MYNFWYTHTSWGFMVERPEHQHMTMLHFLRPPVRLLISSLAEASMTNTGELTPSMSLSNKEYEKNIFFTVRYHSQGRTDNPGNIWFLVLTVHFCPELHRSCSNHIFLFSLCTRSDLSKTSKWMPPLFLKIFSMIFIHTSLRLYISYTLYILVTVHMTSMTHNASSSSASRLTGDLWGCRGIPDVSIHGWQFWWAEVLQGGQWYPCQPSHLLLQLAVAAQHGHIVMV